MRLKAARGGKPHGAEWRLRSATGATWLARISCLDRPFANVDPADNVFKISGQQVNVGVKAQAVGQLAPDLTMYGGITLLEPTLHDTDRAATEGKQYTGTPHARSNLLLECRLPAVPGLAMSANWQHIGKRPANDSNTSPADAADVFNLGISYASSQMARAVTWRVSLANRRAKWGRTGARTVACVREIPATVLPCRSPIKWWSRFDLSNTN